MHRLPQNQTASSCGKTAVGSIENGGFAFKIRAVIYSVLRFINVRSDTVEGLAELLCILFTVLRASTSLQSLYNKKGHLSQLLYTEKNIDYSNLNSFKFNLDSACK